MQHLARWILSLFVAALGFSLCANPANAQCTKDNPSTSSSSSSGASSSSTTSGSVTSSASQTGTSSTNTSFAAQRLAALQQNNALLAALRNGQLTTSQIQALRQQQFTSMTLQQNALFRQALANRLLGR